MASEGPLSPSSVVNDDAVGTQDWSNPGNAAALDGSWAFVDGVVNTTVFSHYLKATNFGFSIPAGATVDGRVVEIVRFQDNSTVEGVREITDSEVKLVVGGTVSGDNKADTEEFWPVGVHQSYKEYGGPTDTWDLLLSAEDVNDPGFGAAISRKHFSSSPFLRMGAYVDHVRITVFYTEAVEGGGFAKRVQRRFRRAGFGGGRAA